jgi:hypothetical protein
MTPKAPPPPAPPPKPPTIDQAAQQADANDMIRRRRGYAATVLPQDQPATRTGTRSVLGSSAGIGLQG